MRGIGKARGMPFGARPWPAFWGAIVLVVSCRQDMHDQPRYKPLAKSDFFSDQRASRPLIPDTVARGHLKDDTHLYEGKTKDGFVSTFPFPVTEAILRRGQERYEIFCTPCHGQTGQGNGIVVERGYPQPPSFHIDRLRDERVGYLFDVISRGFGRMPDYAPQIPVVDRWAIVSYIRALQLSQHATLEDVPPDKRPELLTKRRP